MKILLFTLLLITACLASSFCEGFKEGYKAGFCYDKPYCLEPLAPLCPLPTLYQKDYMDGYNAGFLVGLGNR